MSARQPVQGVSYLPGQRQLPLSGSTKRFLVHKSREPLKPVTPQKVCNIGLFSDDKNQLDLVDKLSTQA